MSIQQRPTDNNAYMTFAHAVGIFKLLLSLNFKKKTYIVHYVALYRFTTQETLRKTSPQICVVLTQALKSTMLTG